jgi:hypothetical protein
MLTRLTTLKLALQMLQRLQARSDQRQDQRRLADRALGTTEALINDIHRLQSRGGHA